MAARMDAPERVHLSNGIPVILQNYDSEVAATYWWIRAGSADERPPQAGFAHFLEHMLFKDAAAKETGRASTGKLARVIESLGGDINAYTSFDQTVSHVTCAEHHWERVIDTFGSMAKPQRFLRSDFEREREVILEELRKNEDSPGRQLFQSLLSATFANHPYGRPVIGYTRTLKAAKVSNLERFYREHYVSGRMGLVLVGPIGAAGSARRKSILKLVEKRYGAAVIPTRTSERAARVVEPALRKHIEVVSKPFDVKTPVLSFAFRAPHLEHADVPVLDLATGVLGMGELGRLYQKLFYGSSIATDASGGLFVPNDPGLAYFQVEMDSIDKMQSAAEQAFEELARFRREGPTAEELERVIVNAESERLYATQTADGLAGRLGFLQFILGDLDFDRRYLDELSSVDSARMKETVSRYFEPGRMACVALVPEANKGFDMKPIAAAASRILAAAEKPKAAAVRASDTPTVETITLPSGMRAIHRDRPNSHVFSIHAVALGGLRLELADPLESAAADWGVSHMMALTWPKGTATRDAKAIAAAVEGRAASFDGFSGRNTVGLQMTGLARDWESLSDLFAETLAEPTFPESETDHSRRVAEDSVRSLEDHSSQLASKLFLENLYEKHPYGHITLGSLESIGGMRGEKLRAFHRAWVRPERLVITVVGAVGRQEVEQWLRALDSRLAALASGPARSILGDIAPEPRLRAPRWAEKNLGREQQHILVGGLGTTVTSDDRFAIRLMQTLLGGQSGRLFIELREKKSLAYTVAPMSFEGIEPGYIGTYIACSPSKREESVQGIRQVLEVLAKRGPVEAEMKRAKEFFLGRRSMELQSDSALAGHYGLQAIYGLPARDDSAIVNRIRKVSAKEVRDACRKYLIDQPMVTSVVG